MSLPGKFHLAMVRHCLRGTWVPAAVRLTAVLVEAAQDKKNRAPRHDEPRGQPILYDLFDVSDLKGLIVVRACLGFSLFS